MARWQARSRRKYTGKKYRRSRKKRKRELERHPIDTTIGEKRIKRQRTMGGNEKLKLFSADHINVTDPTTNETKNVEILGFEENLASKDLNRRHVLTKGAVVETELGKVRITSRPGQQGILNGLLI
ncbi:MAG: 30S ribosomal protein S8e [Promethearchaeota archaeon]|nr:MAG: 30S ribosomal protein S8e [Candidatus Lokiarchaeota archaeon]